MQYQMLGPSDVRVNVRTVVEVTLDVLGPIEGIAQDRKHFMPLAILARLRGR